MTDDFSLFPEAEADGVVIDSDAALITAYLARELSLVQIVAVEERLRSDAAFRENALPIIESWILPGRFESGPMRAAPTGAIASNAVALTRAEIDAGWKRCEEAVSISGKPESRQTVPDASTRTRTRSLTPTQRATLRIAATIAVILVPLVTVAQVVKYIASHRQPSGPGLDRSALPATLQQPPLPAGAQWPPNDSQHEVPMTRSLPSAAALVAGAAITALGQGVSTQPIRAPRPLGPIVATTRQTFQKAAPPGAGQERVIVVRGSVFFNDSPSRQLLLFDSSLTRSRVVLDSTSGTGKEGWYGQAASPGALRRFRGDSVFFVPGGTPEGLVIGPDGRVARVAAHPPAPAAPNGPCPGGDMDANGWTYCERVPALLQYPTAAEFAAASARGQPVLKVRRQPDTGFVVSTNFRTWDVDTVAKVWIGDGTWTFGFTGLFNPSTGRGGPANASPRPRELSDRDVWTVLRDGTIAIARVADYHIDLISPKGEVTRGPKAPFAWRPVTDADRTRLVEVMTAGITAGVAQLESTRTAQGLPGLLRQSPIADRVAMDTWPSYWPPFVGAGRGNGLGGMMTPIPLIFADEDDRIWIREAPTPTTQALNLYAVFDRKGQFLDRVSMPSGQTVIGFGAGGQVYLAIMDGGRLQLARASFK